MVLLSSKDDDFFFFASARNLMGLAIWDYPNSIAGTETFSIVQLICSWAAGGTRAGFSKTITFPALCIPTWYGKGSITGNPAPIALVPPASLRLTTALKGKSSPKCWALPSLDFCPLFHSDPTIFCNLLPLTGMSYSLYNFSS